MGILVCCGECDNDDNAGPLTGLKIVSDCWG